MAKVGRPLKFKSVEELQEKIDEYFAKCDNHKARVIKKDGTIEEVPAPQPYTITGLALHLDTDRQTLCNYEKRSEFFDTIKRAKQKVEEQLERGLWGNNVTGLIFNLKNNFLWKDQQDHKVEGEVLTRTLTDEQAEQILRRRARSDSDGGEEGLN